MPTTNSLSICAKYTFFPVKTLIAYGRAERRAGRHLTLVKTSAGP